MGNNTTKVIIGLVVVLVLALGVWFTVGRPPAEEPIAEDPAVEDPVGEPEEEPAAKEQHEIKIATWHAAEHPITIGLEKFEEIVERESEGGISVQIFPAAQLGPEDVYIDSIKKGTVQMGIAGTLLGRYVPLIHVGEMPFLFDGWDHAKEVFRGPIGEEMTDDLVEKAGVRNLVTFADGFRVITSNFELSNFEKLKGMRLRVPNTPVYIKMTEGFGAVPIAMPFAEVFTALEGGVVDGQENPYATIRSSKFYEVQDYILESNHMFSPRFLIINEDFLNGLSEDFQRIITEAGQEAADYQWQLVRDAEQRDREYLEAKVTSITIPDDTFRQKLIESQSAMYTWFYDEFPGSKELAERIRAAAQ